MISEQNKCNEERSKYVKLNIWLGGIVRGISILTSLMLVPLTIDYISSELYGIWLTLSSVVHWMASFDIGFGNGLRNKLGEAVALGDFKKGKIYVSTTYALMSIIFILFAVLLFFLAARIDWSAFLNVSDQYNATLTRVAQTLFVTFSVQMILKLIQNVCQAFQFSALASFFDTLGNILVLLFIYILTITMAPDLVMIGVVFSISPLIVLIIASIVLYNGRFKCIAPHVKYVRPRFFKDIFNLGSEFFVIQIASLVLFQMINILISRMCGAEQVTNYNVAYKYLSVSTMVVNIVIAPFWSAFTDAYIKGDHAWMSHIYGKLMKLFGCAVLCILFMVMISPYVYQIWIGDEVQISMMMSLFIGIYLAILIWEIIHTNLIYGIGKIRVQLLYSLIIMALFIPLALLLGARYNIYGLLMTMILVHLPGVYLGRCQILQLLENKATGIWNK